MTSIEVTVDKSKKRNIFVDGIPWKNLFLLFPIIVFVLVAIFGPIILGYDPVSTNATDRLLAPGSTLSNGSIAWLGTDSVGRDVLSQIIVGARVSLIVAGAAVLIGGTIGVVLGIVAGYFGGVIDSIIMRIADVQLSFPSILLAILIAGVLGPSITNIIITLAITRWVIFARIVRSTTLTVKGKEFVDSARVLGASNFKILYKYIFPSCISPLLVVMTVQVGLVIIAEASLSFLGLGTPPDNPSWGLLIADGRDYLDSAWWIATTPGIALAIVVISIGFLGDKMRDKTDPKLNVQS